MSPCTFSRRCVLYAALARMTGARGRSAFVAARVRAPPAARRVRGLGQRAQGRPLGTLLHARPLGLRVRMPNGRGSRVCCVVTLCLLLGLLSKSTLVTLPAVLLLLDWWPLGRLGAMAPAGPGVRVTLRRAVLEKLPMFLLVAAVATIIFVVGRAAGAMSSLERCPSARACATRSSPTSSTRRRASGRAASPCSIRCASEASPVWPSLAAALLLAAVSHLRGAPGARAALPRRRLALVPGDARPHDRARPGRRAGARGSLHVPAADRTLDRASPGAPATCSTACARGASPGPRRRPCSRRSGSARGSSCNTGGIPSRCSSTPWPSRRRTPSRICSSATPTCDAGDVDAAERHYARAAAIDPGQAPARLGLADVRAWRGDLAGAIAAYERELRSHPNDPLVAGTLRLRTAAGGSRRRSAGPARDRRRSAPGFGAAARGPRGRRPASWDARRTRSPAIERRSRLDPGQRRRREQPRVAARRPARTRRARSGRSRSRWPSARRVRVAPKTPLCSIRSPSPTQRRPFRRGRRDGRASRRIRGGKRTSRSWRTRSENAARSMPPGAPTSSLPPPARPAPSQPAQARREQSLPGPRRSPATLACMATSETAERTRPERSRARSASARRAHGSHRARARARNARGLRADQAPRVPDLRRPGIRSPESESAVRL